MYNEEKLRIVDGHGRPLLVISKDGGIAFSRHNDLSQEEIKCLADYLQEVGSYDEKQFHEFMNYKDQQTLFCS